MPVYQKIVFSFKLKISTDKSYALKTFKFLAKAINVSCSKKKQNKNKNWFNAKLNGKNSDILKYFFLIFPRKYALATNTNFLLLMVK